ncbi:ARM repeat-containing protein [Xylariomycetidae sp. FL0641]|nr:ARM repeat-containing protein [Xylariomycetidae sp. FL0641]
MDIKGLDKNIKNLDISGEPSAGTSQVSNFVAAGSSRGLSATMDENFRAGKEDSSAANNTEGPTSAKKPINPLSTSSFANQSCPKQENQCHGSSDSDRLRNEAGDAYPIDHLLAKLAENQPMSAVRERTAHNNPHDNYSSIANNDNYPHPRREPVHEFAPVLEPNSSSNSVPITPATDSFQATAPSTRPASAAADEHPQRSDEVLQLRLQLAQAENRISRLDNELAQSRHTRPPGDQALTENSSLGDSDLGSGGLGSVHPQRVQGLQSLSTSVQQPMGREGYTTWSGFDDSRSDTSDALSATGFNRSRNIWGGNRQSQTPFAAAEMPSNAWPGRGPTTGFNEPLLPYEPAIPGPAPYRNERLTPDYDLTVRPQGNRRGNRMDHRFAHQSYGGQSGGYGNAFSHYGPNPWDAGPPMAGGSHGPAGTAMYSGYQPTPIGTPLSPLANEFTSATGGAPWRSEPAAPEGQTYVPTTEPLNYRRLLDRNVNCNWKYIVDKIVCNNDQQASIFLQQKLKVGTPDQKYEIVEAIVAQAYPLMVNRFGNFLVQRCFEHGTPEQVIKIAEAIRGSTLNLSMDPFGCHVVQKAFDSVPEDYKAIMVHELLRRIPETVIHRYACHVWQKLFELRWSESPPQIMKYVNDALRGMWHEVALGETGSLVVQNIFENCLEEDKRPCIEEVLSNIDIVAHGQFGNWCIQHICEHRAPADRSRAIDHVIRYAAEYSMDQYASKVVEKCLKIGGNEFLSRYLERVTEGRMDRPRIPLIDIASDQYGNYLIQWILTHANPQHREMVAAHIRKHMVSLRGSKFGSRVGMLCTNPAVATRPGPGVGTGLGRMPTGPRYGSRPYQ